MHKSLNLDNLGGVYTYQNTFKFIQDAYGSAIDAMAAGYGNKYVVSGCVDNGVSVADGWVIIDGEPMRFIGGVLPGTPKVLVQTITTKASYNDGVQKDFYTTKTAHLVSVGGFNYSELKRLNKGVYDSIRDLETIVRKAINLDAAVILEGCLVSNVNDDIDTCDISAGMVLMDGVLYKVPANEGATFPIYITANGTWNNSLPTAPYIRFDPHTSQRYIDVLARHTTRIGKIEMYETLSDRFDAETGIGKWEMLGFRLMGAMQSRVPVGLWWNGNTVENVTDANHTASENQGGEKNHLLVSDEIPAHRLQTVVDLKLGHNQFPYERGTELSENRSIIKGWFKNNAGAEGYYLDSSATEPTIGRTSSYGGDEAHNNLQPYTVVVYVKRYA